MKKKYWLLFIPLMAAGYFFLQPIKSRLLPVDKNEREFEEREEDGPAEALKQEILMTRDPLLGYVPTERLQQYKEFMRRHSELRAGSSGSNNKITDGSGGGVVLSSGSGGLNWTERGPDNIGGRCRAIIVDKTDPTGNTVLVGSVSGGLWRTTNFTAASPTWTQNGTVLANLAITALAQDPSTPTTMYAGTGEGYQNIDAIRGLGIYKSTDGGITWNLLSSTTTGGANQNDFNFIQSIAVYSNGNIYAAGRSASYCNAGGILQSTDGGNTWTTVVGNYTGCGSCSCANNYNGYDVIFSSGGDIYASVIDASTGTAKGKIYKSPAGSTAGNIGTWTDVTPTGSSSWQRIQLAASATNNNRVYALLQGSGAGIGGIYRTDNAGSSWTNVSSTTAWCSQGVSGSTDFANGQAWYDLTLTVNPANDADVFVAGVDMMQTTNSGSTWSQVTQWASGCASLPYVHADIHNITFLPGSSTSFIVGCDGGIFFTTNGGSSFASKDFGLNVTQYYGTAIDPVSGSNYMLASAQDNGSHIFTSTGVNAVTYASGGDGITCFIDQSNPETQITSYTDATYFISRNAGNSFALTFNSTDGRFLNPASYDDSLKHLYCGSKDQMLKRIDNIVSGTPAGTDITVSSNSQLAVSAVKVDPNTVDNVWVGMSTAADASAYQAPALFLVTGASTGSPVVSQVGATLLPGAGAYINSIDVERGNPNHLVVAVSNYGVASVWESTDHGTTWTSLDNNGVNLPDMPVYWAMIVPANGNVNTGGANGGIMLATEMGVWSTSASAGTSTVWTENSATMGNVSTRMLQYRPADDQVVAATHGRGLFTTSVSVIDLPLTFTSFTGMPAGIYNRLNWTVANESLNKGFTIQRNYNDNTGFLNIGFTPSLSAAFLPSAAYSFTDSGVDVRQPVALYRLMQTDLDGTVTYSNIISIDRAPSSQLVEYLAVSGNTLYLRISGGATAGGTSTTLQILDMAGRILSARELPLQSQSIDITTLAHGVYTLRLLSTNGQQYTGRFLKP